MPELEKKDLYFSSSQRREEKGFVKLMVCDV
jgi:hypothetical protein